MAHQFLTGVLTAYNDEVALVYRHFPLTQIHMHARDAAVASECAAEQGRVEQMHSALFAQQPLIGIKLWKTFAGEAGVERADSFEACRNSEEAVSRVPRMLKRAFGWTFVGHRLS